MFFKDRCDLCGKCLEFCPYFDYDLERAQKEMKELLGRGTPPIVGQCVTCASCNLVCPTQANPFDLLNQRQEETGVLGVPQQAMDNFAKLHALPTVVQKGKEGSPVMNLCIVGDMVKELLGNPLFEGLTIVGGADYFCTVGYIHLGKPKNVRREAQRFVDNLALLGANEVICFHDDCYTMLTALALEYGIKVPFRPIHIKDIYLDKIIELIGAERPARKYERTNALCCGAPLMARDKEKATVVKKWNIDDAQNVHADAMVFLCPMCYLNLRKLVRDEGMEAIFITDLCQKALG